MAGTAVAAVAFKNVTTRDDFPALARAVDEIVGKLDVFDEDRHDDIILLCRRTCELILTNLDPTPPGDGEPHARPAGSPPPPGAARRLSVVEDEDAPSSRAS